MKRNLGLRLETFTNSKPGADVFAGRRIGEGEGEANRKQGFSLDFNKEKGSLKKKAA